MHCICCASLPTDQCPLLWGLVNIYVVTWGVILADTDDNDYMEDIHFWLKSFECLIWHMGSLNKRFITWQQSRQQVYSFEVYQLILTPAVKVSTFESCIFLYQVTHIPTLIWQKLKVYRSRCQAISLKWPDHFWEDNLANVHFWELYPEVYRVRHIPPLSVHFWEDNGQWIKSGLQAAISITLKLTSATNSWVRHGDDDQFMN